MPEYDFDFSELELSVDNRTDAERRRDKRKEQVAKLNDKELQKKIDAAVNKIHQEHLGYVPKKIKQAVFIPDSETKHDVGSPQYNARLDALCYIMRHPELSTRKQIKSMAWRAVTTLPYIKYIWSYGIMPEHLKKIRMVASESGVKLPKEITCESILKATIRKYHLDNEQSIATLQAENELLRALSTYEFTYDHDNNALIFKEFVLNWSKEHRAYHIKIGGKDIKIPLGAKDKFIDTLELLSKLSEL